MKKFIASVFVFVGLSTALFGSATIFKESGGDTVRFSINVDEADVYVDGSMIGRAFGGHFSYQFPRNKKGEKVVMFKKEGYRPAVVHVQRKVDIAFLGNILTGGITGTTTDISSGSIMEHTPSQFMVFMQKAD